ncbi:MAG: hypothetical protein ACF8XB_05335 [Planctomycetota bacterium JB042]
MHTVPIALSFAVVLAAGEWEWTEKEERTLAKLERSVKEDDGIFRLSKGRAWNVETPGSARLAAEVSLYLTMLEDVICDLTGEKRELGAYPTVQVLASSAELAEKAPGARGAAYRYRWESEQTGTASVRKRVVENHLYIVAAGDADAATLDAIDLPALREEGTRAVLCGIFGQPRACAWFEEGMASFLSTWDLHVAGRAIDEAAFEERRLRSSNMAAARAALERDASSGGPPKLASLLAATERELRKKRLVPGMSNEAAAESLIDALLTSKGARSLRKSVSKEIARSAARGRDRVLLESADVARLERLWHEHLAGGED